MTIRVLIVDDEPPARFQLRRHLSRHPEVEVVGEAGSVREAKQLLAALEYDVVFLDVSMPGAGGVDLAAELKQDDAAPRVVFVTGYPEYAVQAFSVWAVDYLLKPFTPERLAETVARLQAVQGRPSPAAAKNPPPAAAMQRLVLRMGRGNTLVPLGDILYLESERGNVAVHTVERSLQVRSDLQDLLANLPAEQFVRCHRSYVVNLAWVRALVPRGNGSSVLYLGDRKGTAVPVSRANAGALRRVLGGAG